MKIGMVIHSQTGNTYSVALKLRDKLLSAGHSVSIERITPAGGEQGNVKEIQIKNLPDVAKYDALVFASPVQGASVSPVLAACLSGIAPLEGKKAACLVTQFFPWAWMGGNRAIGQMKKLCEAKGAVVCGTGIVNWKRADREKRIAEVVESMCKLF